MNYLENVSLKKLITLIKTEIKTNSRESADKITYNNTTSGLEGNSVQEAIDELTNVLLGSSAIEYTATITTTWEGSEAPYTQEITVTGITANDKAIVDVIMSGTYATDKARDAEFGKIYQIVTADNKITVYAHEKTAVELPIQLQVVR